MKVARVLIVLISLFSLIMLQACGSGGGSSDTAGALTISTPTANDNGNGTSSVSFTVTYAPPSGKTAQGVVVSVNVNGLTHTADLTSGSNSVSYSFPAVTNGTTLFISASVNSMTSSRAFFVPTATTGGTGTALTVTPTTADFLFTDPAGAIKTITISGGTAPYIVASSVPTDISSIMATPTSVTVTLNNSAVSASPGISSNATVTVTDSATPAATKIITVTYKK